MIERILELLGGAFLALVIGTLLAVFTAWLERRLL